ncbi:MAG: hypothetical protein HC895_09975, partial [Leptolyngbyaceae cyanobacterium SM1_3_5]|nr:hypothetical protein [Leptolyngbyaceae cyanobacterium SM1_3_5]
MQLLIEAADQRFEDRFALLLQIVHSAKLLRERTLVAAEVLIDGTGDAVECGIEGGDRA